MRYVIRTLVVAAMIGLGATAQAGEESMPLDKLPKGVLAAVKAKFPKGKPVEAAKEVEAAKPVRKGYGADQGDYYPTEVHGKKKP